MKSLESNFLSRQAIPIEMGGLLQKLGEFKGRQDLFTRQSNQCQALVHIWEKRGNNLPKRGNKRGNNT